MSGSTSNHASKTKSCFEVSIKMFRLLRHDPSVLREEDEAVEFRILAQMFRSEFAFIALVNSDMAELLPKKGGLKMRFQYCVDPYAADTILYLRVDLTLQDNVLLPSDFAEHIYHVGSSHDTHSIIQSGLIPGGKGVKKGRHAVFFTAVNPKLIDHYRKKDYDVTKPRIACSVQTQLEKYTKTQCIVVA